ncbi:MAG: PD-(D/E)XK nuclease family protein, partial [Evtepia sp.]
FTRLETLVLSLTGGLAEETLDQGGRLLVMYAALKAVASKLDVYALPSKKPEFLRGLLATVDEMKSYCVSAEELSEAAEYAEGLGGRKLRDLSLIYGAYEAMTARGKLDPRDNLTRLSEQLKNHRIFSDMDLYIDGFTDFTPQENLVIQELLRQANSLVVSLTCDDLEKIEDGPFAPARNTATRLSYLAKKCGATIEVVRLEPPKEMKPPALAYLEETLFSDSNESYQGDASESVGVFTAASYRDEVTWVAQKIAELVGGRGLRYREITVAARSLEPYQELIESVFAGYRIPVFQSAMSDILQKPIFTLIMSAIDAITGNYAYEDMFRYLKTGLVDLSQDECDILENYVLLWTIRGSNWTQESPWNRNPSGYQKEMQEKDRVLLSKLDEIRCKVISPLERFRKNPLKTARGQVISLYNFLEETNVPQKLSEKSELFLAKGEPELALEYAQIWEIFCNALEQCVDLLGDMPTELDEFSRLLRLLLSEYTVGSIPASLDRVTTGDAPRIANRNSKVLFLLGCDDASIPQTAPTAGLLTDRDRDLLAEYGLDLAPRVEQKIDREMTIVYAACTQPKETLFLTWSSGVGEKRPSFLIARIRTLFKDVDMDWPCNGEGYLSYHAALRLARKREETWPFLSDCSAFRDIQNELLRVKTWERGKLSPPAVKALYGSEISMSASRMDKYNSCHFAYYMQYGLHAKPRKKAGIYAPEYGTFVHAVLEFVLREMTAQGGVHQLSNDAIKDLTKQAIDRYAREELGGMESQSPRFCYLFRRLERAVQLVIANVVEELRASEFRPIAFELGFGKKGELPPVELTVDGITLRISGFVDRVDGWMHDGKLYLRVIDYKTGRKSFDFTDIWNGLGLQMLLYLFTLEDKGESVFACQTESAGVLYLPAHEAVIMGSRGMPEEMRKKLVDKELVRKGILLEDPAVLKAMENGTRFLPIRVSTKTGEITGDSLVSAQKLGQLKRHIETILSNIAKELSNGTISADPFWHSAERNACLYCEFQNACHFEEGRDQKHWIPTVKNNEFWTYLEEEDDAKNP